MANAPNTVIPAGPNKIIRIRGGYFKRGVKVKKIAAVENRKYTRKVLNLPSLFVRGTTARVPTKPPFVFCEFKKRKGFTQIEKNKSHIRIQDLMGFLFFRSASLVGSKRGCNNGDETVDTPPRNQNC